MDDQTRDEVERSFLKDMTDLFGSTFVKNLMHDERQYNHLFSIYIKGCQYGGTYIANTLGVRNLKEEVDEECSD